jgi:glutamine synthetase
MSIRLGFVQRHDLWTDGQKRQADEIRQRVERDDIRLIRLAWPDAHGCSRAKMITAAALPGAFSDGYNINVATTTLDSANARVFSSFTRGGGMCLDEMTGSPNITLVPDPATFRVLPWAPGVGWMLCDEYFNSGAVYPFSTRHLLRRQLQRLRDAGRRHVIGLEVEWYLLRLAEDHLSEEHVSLPGHRGRPLKTYPVEPGYSYHSESNLDLMQPLLGSLADALERLGLPLRSIENEWGPGQVECTFSPQDALDAADTVVLFRTAAKQLARRSGYAVTFMCRPALKGYYSSGWHLHQSIADAQSGRNLFTPGGAAEHLSPLGRSFLAGLLEHAIAYTVFTTPTVNGYRRFRPNSLAPDRVCWGYDHRGALLRVLGSEGDPATRVENRIGEPAANPYLYILSQIVAGLDGIERHLEPGPPEDEPYAAERPALPRSLADALDALERAPLFRRQLGDVFVEYFLKVKRNEWDRYRRHVEEHGEDRDGEDTTAWEQNEYFDFF